MEEKDDRQRNEENHIGRYVNHLSKTIRYAMNSFINKQGEDITMEQCRIISYISRRNARGEAVYQKDIENDFGVKRSSVASILANMEKNGYIVRNVGERDARVKLVSLTEKGMSREKQMYENICTLEAIIARGMTEAEQVEFIRLIKLAVNNVESSEILHEGNIKIKKGDDA